MPTLHKPLAAFWVVALVAAAGLCAAVYVSPALTAPLHATQSSGIVLTAEPLAQSSIPQVTITAHDSSFDAPDSFPAGLVSIRLRNEASKPSGAQLLRLNPGVTLEALAAASHTVAEDPAAFSRLFIGVGGPEGVAPGMSQEVTVTLTEGQYIILNVLDHFDRDYLLGSLLAGQIPSFPLFYTPFQVAGPGGANAQPPVHADILMPDFSYVLPATLPAGRNVLSVANTGRQVHEMAVGRIADDASMDDVIAYFQDPLQPKSFDDVVSTFPNQNVDDANGLSTLSPGLSAAVSFDFTPGKYVVVCFLRDPGSGLPHVALGMIAGFTVR